MLEDRRIHDALLLISVACCIFGAAGLFIGVYLSYCYANHNELAFASAGGGSLMFFTGMLVGNYTKRNSRR